MSDIFNLETYTDIPATSGQTSGRQEAYSEKGAV